MVLAAAGCLCAAAWFALAVDERIVDPLTLVLAAGAVVANLLSVRYSGPMFVSASFTCSIVALAIVGPAAAFFVALVGTVGEWVVVRYRLYALAVNVLGAGVPNLLAGTIFAARRLSRKWATSGGSSPGRWPARSARRRRRRRG